MWLNEDFLPWQSCTNAPAEIEIASKVPPCYDDDAADEEAMDKEMNEMPPLLSILLHPSTSADPVPSTSADPEPSTSVPSVPKRRRK